MIKLGALVNARLIQVLECDEFYGLGPEQVAALIASDTITVPNEEKVWILLPPPKYLHNKKIFRCLKALLPGFNTQWKLGPSTFPPSWSTSGCLCSPHTSFTMLSRGPRLCRRVASAGVWWRRPGYITCCLTGEDKRE